jgi:hypothetical protein
VLLLADRVGLVEPTLHLIVDFGGLVLPEYVNLVAR